MRQSSDSPLIYLANLAREGKKIDVGTYGNVRVIYEDDLVDSMFVNSEIVLCGKNITREKINNYVRHDIRHIDTDFPCYGERLICRKNNWKKELDGISLANGLVGTVMKPPSIERFVANKELVIDFKPDLLDRCFEDLVINYDYLNIIGDPKTKEYMKKSKYVRGELMEYAYGSTVHLAQGSEYSTGMYFEEYLHPDTQSNLNYTAITRFKQNMVYVKRRPKMW